MMYLTGMKNIRDVIPFHALPARRSSSMHPRDRSILSRLGLLGNRLED